MLELIRRERVHVLAAVPRTLQLLRAQLLGQFADLDGQIAAAQGKPIARRWWRFRRVHRALGLQLSNRRWKRSRVSEAMVLALPGLGSDADEEPVAVLVVSKAQRGKRSACRAPAGAALVAGACLGAATDGNRQGETSDGQGLGARAGHRSRGGNRQPVGSTIRLRNC